MVEFTLWDILRNLLQAARWTVLLSLVAFVGGSVVALALTLYSSAFLCEIWRGCVAAIPKGQWEAAASLAMSIGEQMRPVVGPQALRIAIAPTVGFGVQVIKGTALASVIGFIEPTKAGTMITSATFRPFTMYACVASLYFVLCWPLSAWSRALERKLRRGR
jgi:polar amino acid transport system permease protein